MPITPRSGTKMRPSQFNLRVPVDAHEQVFLMNTLTDAQLVVSRDVAALLDRLEAGDTQTSDEEIEALDLLADNGFVVADYAADRRALDDYLADVKSDT